MLSMLGKNTWDKIDAEFREMNEHKGSLAEARAEIERLERWVERLRGVVRKRAMEADDADYRAYTAWNDAIEAAYGASEQYPPDDMTSAERDAFILGCMTARDAIRALKRSNP